MNKKFAEYFLDWGKECIAQGQENVEVCQAWMMRLFGEETKTFPWQTEYGKKLLELYDTDRMMFLFCMAGYLLKLYQTPEEKRKQYHFVGFDKCCQRVSEYIDSKESVQDMEAMFDTFESDIFKKEDVIEIFINEFTDAMGICYTMLNDNK